MFDDEIDAALRELQTQWNIAERRIKKAELVRASEVVAPAIFELRYAGRKLVDAMALILDSEWQCEAKTKQTILRQIGDATEDCVKAKHDAIDAMLVFVTAWFERTEGAIGLDGLVKYFPEYIKVTGKISNLYDRIAESRGDRNKSRDDIYDSIETADYAGILDLYAAMAVSETRVQAQVEAEREQVRRNERRAVQAETTAHIAIWIGIAGAAFGLAGAVFAGLALR